MESVYLIQEVFIHGFHPLPRMCGKYIRSFIITTLLVAPRYSFAIVSNYCSLVCHFRRCTACFVTCSTLFPHSLFYVSVIHHHNKINYVYLLICSCLSLFSGYVFMGPFLCQPALTNSKSLMRF